MSKKEKVTNQNEEKVMTNYERKQQMREEAKKKEKKALLIERTVVAVTVLALVALVASFPIRTHMALNETYVVVGGEEISKMEYDYNFYVTRNNYINQYNQYLSVLGLDTTADLSTQMYSETMTWKDFFDQQTVASMARAKALEAEAKNAGFTYDAEAEFKEFEETVKQVSADENVSVKNYMQQMYGPYATMARIKEFAKEGFYVNAYYMQKIEENEPSEEEIQAYYDANSKDFDYVDYRIITVETEVAEGETATEEDIDRLQKIVDEMQDAVDHDDMEKTAQLNREFHGGLEKLSDKRRIMRVIDSQEEYIMRFSAVSIAALERRRVVNQEHYQMVEMLRNKDLEGLIELNKRHLEESKNACLRAVKGRGF